MISVELFGGPQDGLVRDIPDKHGSPDFVPFGITGPRKSLPDAKTGAVVNPMVLYRYCVVTGLPNHRGHLRAEYMGMEG